LIDRSVLEVGAGIGDHTSFYLDRGCTVTVTDGRPANLTILRRRFPELRTGLLDLDKPVLTPIVDGSFEIVHCYGTLYHLSQPESALTFLDDRCSDMLVLETCVSPGEEDDVNLIEERRYSPSQAVSGRGCRPTRTWVFRRLKTLFPYVYLPRTQPAHEEFPLDWEGDLRTEGLKRAVFIASRNRLDNPILVEELPRLQSLLL